tara:strand:+ start:11387 stop:12301 length:915 start_codon:yes stop_codon:yes gene_type:complete
METNQNIIPNLWFNKEAEEAAKFYTSIFGNSKIGGKTYYAKEGQEIHGQKEGQVMTIEFQIENYKMVGLNGGPIFKLNPSISFFVMCDTEVEENNLWANFCEGGNILMPLDRYDWSGKYGWVQDRFGVSWQFMLREGDETTQKISPSLLYMGPQRGHAEEALRFYTDIFKHSNIDGIKKYEKEEIAPEGFVKHAQFQLLGQNFMVMDAGQDGAFRFNEAMSFIVHCKDQDEIDYYWKKLGNGGDPKAQQCGWLKDKFGVSWQIVPTVLMELLKSGEKEKTECLFKAFMTMKKLDIETLKSAFKG